MLLKCVAVILVAVIYLKINREDTFNPGKDIKGKNVLITGASQGIGEQIAYRYAEMGANVFITARNENRLKQVLNECVKKGRKDGMFGYAVADMEMYDITAADVINEAVKLFGRLDHLILNHAYIADFDRWHGTTEDFRKLEKTIEIDLISYIHLASHAIPHLKKSEFGRLAVVSSFAGKMDTPYGGAYSSAKFGLDGFFSSLRQEFKSHKENISITLCILGFIDTKTSTQLLDKMTETLNLDPVKISTVVHKADPVETATQIIKATSRGDRELYYPSPMGSQFIARLVIAMRSLYPELFDVNFEKYKED